MNEPIHTLGFSWRKRQILRRFYPQASIAPLTSRSRLDSAATLAIWGRHPPPLNAKNMQKLWVEDGFIRSIGLGAALTPPFSWIFDPTGIYYDASSPSALEMMLEFEVASEELLARAKNLRSLIIEHGITKYNLPEEIGDQKTLDNLQRDIAQRKKLGKISKVILVPGQVESDASIRYGGIDILTNLELLKEVRTSNPKAYILYKAHPDEVAGLRSKTNFRHTLNQFCDHIESKISIHQLYKICDEIHTITSLSGFEGLIRGCAVHCYGMPFYAGWGLTQDRHHCHRRTRKITLLELIAASLIRYPQYIHPRTQTICSPEEVINQLILEKHSGLSPASQVKKNLLEAMAKFYFYLQNK